MNNKFFTKITPDGGVFFMASNPDREPSQYDPKNPVRVSVRRDFGIEIHAENFSAVASLTPGQALGLAGILIHLAREEFDRKLTEFVEVGS